MYKRQEEVTLQNLKLTNAYVKSEAGEPDGTGILVGHISNVKVRNCHVSGTVTGSEQIGGMFGEASELSLVIVQEEKEAKIEK